jgi:hypothetical protein
VKLEKFKNLKFALRQAGFAAQPIKCKKSVAILYE